MSHFNSICQNPWCKATFVYIESEMLEVEGEKIPPKSCAKCRSFENELSGGVEWNDRNYEGQRYDNKPHQIKYKVTNFKL